MGSTEATRRKGSPGERRAGAKRFDEFAVVPERFHDAGDVVVVEGRAAGKTKTGGILDARAAWVWTVRDGLVTANHNYHDTDAWRIALSAP